MRIQIIFFFFSLAILAFISNVAEAKFGKVGDVRALLNKAMQEFQAAGGEGALYYGKQLGSKKRRSAADDPSFDSVSDQVE